VRRGAESYKLQAASRVLALFAIRYSLFADHTQFLNFYHIGI
jgi:hypothetical protein